ncbi:hypothetical protein [Bacillus sp. T33-2]|uniref:hypothetical protein n=1 Tax=Bacillus sp. T33-2 TaxID=2054168 RepID=UPI000C778A64|nr:hypothetical protein [Bacillus sp. T33-2]PLR95750.1 hypothetical protein CVD19_13520 [Bacillus sp. T33-2]
MNHYEAIIEALTALGGEATVKEVAYRLLNIGGAQLAGNLSASSNKNKEILKQILGLRQVSNTSVFVKKGYFVLSPSIQNNTTGLI